MARKGTKQKEVGIGVIGVGAIGVPHLETYQKMEGVKVWAVADIDKKRADAVAKGHDVPHVFTDCRKLLKLKEIDGVSICLPNAFHAPAAVAALRAGKHVLLEKPMAVNAREAAKIVRAANKARKHVMMAMSVRMGGDSQALKEIVDSGELGDIYYVRGYWIRRNGIPHGWFRKKELSGGGPVVDLGVHLLDLMWWLIGQPQPLTVSASTFAKLGVKGKGYGDWGVGDPNAKVDVEDLAAALIRFKGGITASLETSWASYIEHDMSQIQLLGTKGGATWKPLQVFKDLHGVPVDISPQPPKLSGMEVEVGHFLDAIRKNVKPPSPGEDGLAIMQMLDAIYESGKKAQEVKL